MMKVIIVSQNSNKHKQWHLSRRGILIAGSILALIVSGLWYYKNLSSGAPLHALIKTTDKDELSDSAAIQSYYAKRLGKLQAEVTRIEVLIKKLATMTGNVDMMQYSLDDSPPQGGIDASGATLDKDEFDRYLSQFESTLKKHATQLAILQEHLITQQSITSTIPSGKPIKEGWISSYYGYRIDPFNGKKAFHHGLDFAGKLNSPVHAIADGIVIWQGWRKGYGKLVEVDHGNGYVTRYAHNGKLTVKSGDRVKRGQQVALMGSSGRSTGPHVHLEVLLDGQKINPYHFVKK